ncbi:site-specific integrase [Agrobacterium tumefaciens]|uniref:site-specific integrase n=1 Tax=Agrobacterium tumefaciens TaxID=358 RepID=UPI0021D2035F|nr:site-specific integrase [Agrobacterium tumefaciens]UXT20025.1 site-specific integrase [Agrobacterium tumefaciens]
MNKARLPGFEARYLYLRGDGNFVYRRPIPEQLRLLAGRKSEFKESLRTRDPVKATVRYGELHSKYENILEQLKNGIPFSSRKMPSLAELKDKAKEFNLPYKSADDLMEKADMRSMMTRLAKWEALGRPTGVEMSALFGSLPDLVSIQNVLEFYEEHTRVDMIGKTKREASKSQSPVKAAVKRFRDFVGSDIPLEEIKRSTANEYKSHLIGIVEKGKLTAESANKTIMHLRKIITFYIENMDLEMSNPFAGIRLKGKKNSRPVFSLEFIKQNWLRGDPFATLNDEARGALFAMIDTGCGPKEIIGLDASEIRLDAEIPHIVVQANKYRQLKTDHRGRTIPLIGHALKAFQANPEGFPAYRRPTGADALSAVLMKHLKTNKLLETDDHSVYSLRHMFKDRMRKHKIPEELQNFLMGHKNPMIGASYGAGYDLASTLEYLKNLESDWK